MGPSPMRTVSYPTVGVHIDVNTCGADGNGGVGGHNTPVHVNV
jgi:hypothetical protein